MTRLPLQGDEYWRINAAEKLGPDKVVNFWAGFPTDVEINAVFSYKENIYFFIGEKNVGSLAQIK